MVEESCYFNRIGVRMQTQLSSYSKWAVLFYFLLLGKATFYPLMRIWSSCFNQKKFAILSWHVPGNLPQDKIQLRIIHPGSEQQHFNVTQSVPTLKSPQTNRPAKISNLQSFQMSQARKWRGERSPPTLFPQIKSFSSWFSNLTATTYIHATLSPSFLHLP